MEKFNTDLSGENVEFTSYVLDLFISTKRELYMQLCFVAA